MKETTFEAIKHLLKKEVQPYKWQLDAVKLAARNILALVVACGAGKTLAAILIALVKQKPVIIIAPTHRLCNQWKEAITETVKDADVWLYSKPEETKEGTQHKERFEKWLKP
jgi:superfamily II DNA or RNA helicase